MDFLTTLFLESPIYLGILSLVLFGVALFVRRARPTTVGRWIVPGAAALILLLFSLQHFITTQREHIRSQMELFVSAIESKDMAGIRQALSPRHDSEGMDSEGMATYLEAVLSRMKIYDTRFMRRDITVHEGEAAMLLTARATVSFDGQIGDMHWGTWKIGWRKNGDTWQIDSIVPVVVDGVQFDSFRQLRPHIP